MKLATAARVGIPTTSPSEVCTIEKESGVNAKFPHPTATVNVKATTHSHRPCTFAVKIENGKYKVFRVEKMEGGTSSALTAISN